MSTGKGFFIRNVEHLEEESQILDVVSVIIVVKQKLEVTAITNSRQPRFLAVIISTTRHPPKMGARQRRKPCMIIWKPQ